MKDGRFLATALATLAMGSARADVPAYDFNWAYIHDENNPAYPGGPPFNGNAGRGSVSYAYRISRLEVTTQQWADFVNMALRQGVSIGSAPDIQPWSWGATSAGSQYMVTSPLQPVIGLNWRAGAYYCNWLNNGKQESWASCQSGAYDTSTFGDLPDGTWTDQLSHSPGAKFWIPQYDEWLKAAHYDPRKDGTGGWWSYSTASETAPVGGPPGVGESSADWNPGGGSQYLVPLGAYTDSQSAYGLWDLSGGAEEWTEEAITPWNGRFRNRRADGSYAGGGSARDHIQERGGDRPSYDGFHGFRIAGLIPTPSTVTVALLGMAGLVRQRRR